MLDRAREDHVTYSVVVRTLHETIVEKERSAVSEQAVTFHFSETNTSSDFPSLGERTQVRGSVTIDMKDAHLYWLLR